MARKSKIDPDLKVELVERYLCGGLTLREAARISGLSVTSFVNWVAIYRNEGRAGLLVQKHNKRYPAELKLAAVCAYLDGEGSQAVIAARYGL